MQYTNCEFCDNNSKECTLKETLEKGADLLKGLKWNGYLELNCLAFKSILTLTK